MAPLSWSHGPRAIGATETIYYDHPSKGPNGETMDASRLHLVAAYGTFATTAKLTVYAGWPGRELPIAEGVTMSTVQPMAWQTSDLVIQPGQRVKWYFQNATAGDIVTVGLEGH